MVLVEIDNGGLRGQPQILPLPATPIYQLEYPDAEQALVNYTLHWQAGVHDRDGLCQQIQEIFPRWYARTLKQMGSESGAGGLTMQHFDDVADNVRDYLKRNLGEHADWREISALAEELMATETIREEFIG